MRVQSGVLRIARQLLADRVGLRGNQAGAVAANDVGIRDALQRPAKLILERRPEIGVPNQLTALVRRGDGGGHRVRCVDHTERRLHDRVGQT